MSTTTIAGLLLEDRLEEATAVAVQSVKSDATSAQARMELAQLLAVQGDLTRAETHAKMAQTQAMDLITLIATFRQSLRGFEARSQWWSAGAVPDFPLGPTDCDRDAIAVNVAISAGDASAASAAAEALEAKRPALSGMWNESRFDDLRDLDDRLPHAIEAVTPGGNYLWIDMAKVKQITCAAPTTPFDLMARAARVTLRDGSAAEMLLPAIYPNSATAAHQLGRSTDFAELIGGLTAAQGQRSFLAGDDVVGLLDLEVLEMDD